jgi:hypothetical protein
MAAKSALPRGCAAVAAASSLTAKRQPSTLPSAGVCIAGPVCAYVQPAPERSQYDQ